MPDDDTTPRKILKDATRVLGERLDSAEFEREYPPLSGDRTEYLHAGDQSSSDLPLGGLRVGVVVDGYRIKRQIGRGGMGVVYEAEQVNLGRTVALKVMPPGAVRNERSVDRFRREATAVARLSHPRIVAVHGFNISDGLAYIAMEFVQGLDLAEVIDRLRTARTHGRRFVRISGPELEKDITEWAQGRKLIGTVPGDPRLRDGIVIDLRNPFPMAAALVADAADALRHAHAHGVIHRDIKPSNLILSREGRLKLSDFGLAKDTDAGSLTESGDFVGSPAYVSPEQASPRRVRVDERSDIYSLGVTLYELVTLHQPFGGKHVAVILRQILTKDPPPPSKLNPRVPRDLETIVLKAIEKDPDRRYASAEELGEDLRRFLNFEPIRARPLGAASRTLRQIRRHRMGVAVGTLLIAVLVLSALLAMVQSGASGPGEDQRRLEQALLARGLPAAQHERALRWLAQLSAAESAGDRRDQLDAALADAQAALTASRVPELVARLAVLDAFAARGSWDEQQRALLAASTVGIKVEFAQRLWAELAANASGGFDRRQKLSVLEGLLQDPDWLVVENAATALGSLSDSSSLGALLDALGQEVDAARRRALIGGLRRYGHPDSVALLSEALHDESPAVRMAALEALDELDPNDLLQRLAPLARDKATWIRHRYDAVLARRGRR
ncbi:MAG: hypothetical protein DHS20C15_07500 [Planctomycetota bacterium]|nr:MAG: hypothetical protein DHS20C15_07500 [Planctomycetota bacterium]